MKSNSFVGMHQDYLDTCASIPKVDARAFSIVLQLYSYTECGS